MRFWDSSAIIPLCLREANTDIMKRLAIFEQNDPQIFSGF